MQSEGLNEGSIKISSAFKDRMVSELQTYSMSSQDKENVVSCSYILQVWLQVHWTMRENAQRTKKQKPVVVHVATKKYICDDSATNSSINMTKYVDTAAPAEFRAPTPEFILHASDMIVFEM